MVDTGIFATTAEVQAKVGANASATANAEAYINQFMTEAESYINCITKYNWSDAYAGLSVDVKGILKMAASCIAAIKVINYDMSGMALSEAQTRIDVLTWWVDECIKLLKDDNVRAFISEA